MLVENKHITEYDSYWKVLIGLLLLTALTILAPGINLTAMTVLIALLIASVKAVVVIAYFMHLKFEGKLFKILVIMVLLIYTSVIVLTFSDYMAR